MASLSGIMTYLKNPTARRIKLLHILGDNLSDEDFTRKLYKIKTGKSLNLENPKTYTEKLQWLKLYDHRPEYTLMQDKYLIRDYVSKTIGDEYLIPLLGVWESANDIDFEVLPNQFVLKCNHDCASVVICRNKKTLNFEETRMKLDFCLKNNYYKSAREWAYKDIKPLIIAEKYMSNHNEKTLTDYKFFCCSGKAKMVLLASGEAHTDERRLDYFDMSFNHLPITRGSMNGTGVKWRKPDDFDLLIQMAEKIAGNFPFIRVDFYIVEGHPYFGEIAFYPSAGLSEFSPREWEERVGSWIELPIKQ